MAKPDFPRWATEDQIDPISGQNNVVEPPTTKKDNGWARKEIPPRQWFNWLGRKTYEVFEFLSPLAEGAAQREGGNAFEGDQDVDGVVRANEFDGPIASDISVKHVLGRYDGDLSANDINIVAYTRKDDPKKVLRVGVIAQDIQKRDGRLVIDGDRLRLYEDSIQWIIIQELLDRVDALEQGNAEHL